MNGIAVLVTLAAIGVDYGWQPLSDGQLEYIIQIEPALLDGLKSGEEIVSEIPPQARGVRKFRIRVGTGAVPRIGHLESSTSPRSLTTPSSSFPTSGASAVLPNQGGWGSPAGAAGGGGFGSDVGPNGFLILPPPPALLGADGKNSVLVRPGGTGFGTGVPPARVADNPAASSGSNTLELAPPPTSGGYSGAPWSVPDITGPDNSLPGGGVFPPRMGSESPPTGPVLPPTDFETAPPVRPVPSSNSDSATPDPIRFGASGIRPPAKTGDGSNRPERPTSSSRDDSDLMAQLADADTTAMQKPAISKETAEQLEAEPWMPLVLTSLALFASLAANLYLGWVAVGIYRRYRDIVGQLHQAQASMG